MHHECDKVDLKSKEVKELDFVEKERIEKEFKMTRKFGIVKVTIGKWKYVKYSSTKRI